MKFKWVIIFLLVSLLSTPLWTDSIDPKMQFLEVVNQSDQNTVIELIHYEKGIYAVRKKHKIKPGARARFPDAFSPGLQNLGGKRTLEFWVGPQKHVPSFQVNNYIEKTFMYGKQLTVYRNGLYNIKPVRFLHGIWTIKRRKGRGKWQVWELNLSHVKPEFNGSFLHKRTGKKTTMKGKIVGRVAYFSFGSVPGSDWKVRGEVKIITDGIWRGKLNITYTEKGRRKTSQIPITITADFYNKLLVVR